MAILSTKLKNAFKALPDSENYSMNFKNININGEKRGCWGYITNLENDVCVYIDTERSCMSSLGMLYRYAEKEGDCKGGVNHFAQSLEEIVNTTQRMLKDPQSAENELACWGKHYQGKEPVQRKRPVGLDSHGGHKPAVPEKD